MRARISLLVAIAGACAFVPAAFALQVPVGPGDSVDVLNTKIECFEFTDKNNVHELGCDLATTAGAVKGGYGVLVRDDGHVAIFRVDSKRHLIGVWQARGKSSARATGGTYYSLKAGDSFKPDQGRVACLIIDLTNANPTYNGRRVVCSPETKTGKPVPNSYGVVISDKFVGSFRFDAKGHVGPNAIIRFQPK